jgi:hypothetical protein
MLYSSSDVLLLSLCNVELTVVLKKTRNQFRFKRKTYNRVLISMMSFNVGMWRPVVFFYSFKPNVLFYSVNKALLVKKIPFCLQ